MIINLYSVGIHELFVSNCQCNLSLYVLPKNVGLGCSRSLSTIFQLYRGGQFYWLRIPECPEKTSDLPYVTDTIYHIKLYRVHFSWRCWYLPNNFLKYKMRRIFKIPLFNSFVFRKRRHCKKYKKQTASSIVGYQLWNINYMGERLLYYYQGVENNFLIVKLKSSVMSWNLVNSLRFCVNCKVNVKEMRLMKLFLVISLSPVLWDTLMKLSYHGLDY